MNRSNMRYSSLVVFFLLFCFYHAFAQEDKGIGTVSVIPNTDADGYCGTETPLQIKFVANSKFNSSINCELQCSFDGRNTWNTIKHYEGSITQNCTLQVQYPDMLPMATDDNYFNNMGKDIAKRMHGLGQF